MNKTIIIILGVIIVIAYLTYRYFYFGYGSNSNDISSPFKPLDPFGFTHVPGMTDTYNELTGEYE